MSRWSNRRGATLPLALLVIALLSMVVAAGFTRTSSERRITANQQAQVDAFAVAQSGLERYMVGVTTLPGSLHDTTITGLPGGSAVISLRRLRDTTGGRVAIYFISSRGINSAARRYDTSAPPAERTVAQYAVWNIGSLDVEAAFTSLSGIIKNGASGSFNGTDGCGRKPTIPGAAVPNGLYSGHAGPIDGSPEDTAAYLGTPDTNGTAQNAVHVDWQGILNGALTPNYVLSSGSGNWPSSAQMNTWPTIRINGDYELNGGSTDGKGILLVSGDLTISGSWRHQGIVLVGGTLISNGNNQIHGALITGLNIKLGTAVLETAVGNGNKTFRYNSCMIDSAASNLSGFTSIGNAWMDNLPTW